MTPTECSIFEQFDYWNKAAMPSQLSVDKRQIIVIGCGTSYNLALSVAAVLSAQGYRAAAVPAGEWLLRPTSYVPQSALNNVQVIALSRSGTTTETVQAAAASQARGQHVTGITCDPGSPLCAVSDVAFEYETHPAEGIVMTASASLMLLAGFALAGLKIDAALSAQAAATLKALDAVPVSDYADRTHFVFLGGGPNYGVALEGALKLQEMAICFTQGFHPGEYRHGPISLVDERSAAIILYHPDTAVQEAKLAQELRDKGAFVVGMGGPGDVTVPMSAAGALVAAEVLPALQLLGERYAAARGIDTQTPRHLTKVVVLED
ncbi:MAG: SIS domain-containing protein [Rhodobacteraceae bacterium]|nr:SIS domain-containing protein [Paracoccaceae bacterium]PHR53647.1 MAG: glucosamine-fructose-6-phosphate aminotransferase [Robiginitomaculum sp.]